jgi:NitT/TauT family transport system permease protein
MTPRSSSLATGRPSRRATARFPQLDAAARRRLLVKGAATLTVPVILIGLWEGMIRWLKVPNYLAPPPSTIATGIVNHFSLFMTNVETTAWEALAGFGIGTAFAAVLALVFLYVPPIRTGLMPVAIAFSTVPILAIAPILVIIFGQGFLSKVVMTAMIAFFPTLVNLIRGLETIDERLLDVFGVLNANRIQVLLKVRVFSARPYLFAALRTTATAAVIGAIVAEWVDGERGLGFMIIQETFNFDGVLLWGGIVLAIALATCFFLAVVVLDKLTARIIVR